MPHRDLMGLPGLGSSVDRLALRLYGLPVLGARCVNVSLCLDVAARIVVLGSMSVSFSSRLEGVASIGLHVY